MITEDYVSFETAKLLKEKGFDEPCECFYDTENNDVSIVNEWMVISNSELEKREFVCYSAPTLQMAMKWLREMYNIFIAINMVPKIPGGIEDKRCYFFQPYKNRIFHNFPLNYSIKIYSTYEKTCEAAIKYCLKNLI